MRIAVHLGEGTPEAPPYTQDPDVAHRLWDASASLTMLSEGVAS